MFDATANIFNDEDDSNKVIYSCLVTGLIGYSLFFMLLILQYINLIKLNTRQTVWQSKVIQLSYEIALITSYISVTAIWRTYWTVRIFII
jgi:hypothetical protein